MKKNAKTVFLIIYEGVDLLDIAGPLSIFSKTNDIKENSYIINVVSIDKDLIATNSNISLHSNNKIEELIDIKPDILIIPGCAERKNPFLGERSSKIFKLSENSRQVVCVCNGIFLLAASNAINNRRCTTHWDSCEKLKESFPSLLVDSESIFVQDGKYWSSAGMLAAIDMCLALVEQDWGHEVAMQVAKIIISPGKRAGDSKQVSDLLKIQSSSNKRFENLLLWIDQNLEKKLSLQALADKISMSPRNLTRKFKDDLNTSPAAYIKNSRLERARTLLIETTLSINLISEKCGFNSIDAFQRSFQLRWNINPKKFRSNSKNTYI